MKPRKKPYRKLKITLGIILVLLALLVGAFFYYVSLYYKAGPTVREDALSFGVALDYGYERGYFACLPTEREATTGYIFYPGGKVQSEAYLPYLAQVAEQGYFCAVVTPPFRLAIFDVNAAQAVMDAYPNITTWAVGGHSLGGVAAAGFAARAVPGVKGLALLAAYPTEDLSQSGLAVTSITATGDEVLNWDKYEEARGKLPQDTEYISIQGGNHGQFGQYGPQKGDGEATITPVEQHLIAAQATGKLLAGL